MQISKINLIDEDENNNKCFHKSMNNFPKIATTLIIFCG